MLLILHSYGILIRLSQVGSLKNLYEGHLTQCFLKGVVSLDGFKVSLPKLRSWT